jgi:hypothetical protein
MKRDLDLYRSLLDHFESLKAGTATLQLNAAKFGCTPHELVEHLELMIEQGLLCGEAKTQFHIPDGGTFCIHRLTAAGHDFLCVSRNESVWSATKDRMKKAGAWTFSVIVEILKEDAKHRFGLLLHGSQ